MNWLYIVLIAIGSIVALFVVLFVVFFIKTVIAIKIKYKREARFFENSGLVKKYSTAYNKAKKCLEDAAEGQRMGKENRYDIHMHVEKRFDTQEELKQFDIQECALSIILENEELFRKIFRLCDNVEREKRIIRRSMDDWMEKYDESDYEQFIKTDDVGDVYEFKFVDKHDEPSYELVPVANPSAISFGDFKWIEKRSILELMDSYITDAGLTVIGAYFSADKELCDSKCKTYGQHLICRVLDTGCFPVCPPAFQDGENENMVRVGLLVVYDKTECEHGEISEELKKRFSDINNLKCCECGLDAWESRSTYHQPLFMDHIVPVSEGGQTVEENLQLLCWECKAKKLQQDESLEGK